MQVSAFAFRRVSAALVGLMVVSLLTLAQPANAQVGITVTSNRIGQGPATDDPVPDGCQPLDCSLREAVILANANPGSTIDFDSAGTIELSQLGGGPGDDATADDLDITEEVTITGHVDGTTVDVSGISPGPQARAFDITPAHGLVTFTATMAGMRIISGENNDDGGGAIRAERTDLNLQGMEFEDNEAVTGGAVAVIMGSLYVEFSSFAVNNAARQGGAIWAEGTDPLSVRDSAFTDNTAGGFCCFEGGASGEGGAISVERGNLEEPGPLVVARSTFDGNYTLQDGKGTLPAGSGGAIHASARPVDIADSVFTGNGLNGEDEAFTRIGGAIIVESDFGGEVSVIRNTSLSGNAATDFGGGIALGNSQGVQIIDSTIDNNVVFDESSKGGGIHAVNVTMVEVLNSTVSNNTSSADGAGIHIDLIFNRNAPAQRGVAGQFTSDLLLEHATVVGNMGVAGIASPDPLPSVTLASTLVAGHDGANCAIAGTAFSQDFNLEDADDCGIAGPSDQINTDPVIGPLADNGGVDQGVDGSGVGFTHALLDGSPAIDTANPAICPDPVSADERGVSRPQGPGCDIGAYEAQQEPPPEPELDVDKVAVPAVIPLTDTSTFTIDVTNIGQATAEAVTLTDEVPAGLRIAGVTPTGVCDVVGQSITCDAGDLTPGQTFSIDVAVVGEVRGTYTNTASAVRAGGTPVTDDAELIVTELGVGGQCIGDDTSSDSRITEGINRIQGLNRIQTAIAASQAACGPGEAPSVILTRSDLFPDAQAGTPLAVDRGAPLLLSAPVALDPATETEIQRILNPGGVVYLLGGTVALSDAVNDRLVDLGYQTIRYGGINRFETAAIIAEDGLDNPDTLLVADGGDFADSIVAGAAASNVGMSADVQAAVLLTSDVNIPPETAAYLDGLQGADPTLITIGVDAGVAYPAPAENIAGASRFETAVAVADRFFDGPPIIGVARSDDFPDGLTGGALVGRRGIGPGPMILVATDTLPTAVQEYLTANQSSIETVVIFGGTAAVSQSVEDDIAAALGL